jgi:hypothetical protein
MQNYRLQDESEIVVLKGWIRKCDEKSFTAFARKSFCLTTFQENKILI